ncbi:glucosamine--fructose-6-phosphate aminotransferase [Ralstonia pickettii]|jgi:predicted glutamine amidotransferase|uniref:Gamma-glutamyl-hercynylcysteine sulfoxide hydrolase n=7 Tax=Pseudomonadota TaxID=1224 RepID=A0ABM9IRH3_RALPI|nr:Gamma-glutamyl-hercynylcysteine sulfoxide hydrolase [Ralstonia pickettii]CAJ0727936.1 Gamma-glutamyl-hercynylcysteine sulfoxide hydrolase [Ralstonia pickettii]SUE00683.1 glucosamine--fructose-6-phosphate aminotransferase [Ralstonia pickettii]
MACGMCATPGPRGGAVKTKALGTPGGRQDNEHFIASDFSPTMCQLLGMNCAEPTDVTFSFTGFAARGGVTDHHADGFGVAFFEDKACRLFIDNQSAGTSPVAELVKRYPIKSKNVISHIRKATQGTVRLENCHPFMRELWGRHWIFAHNGDLKNFSPFLSGVYQPVGDTDSELAFCFIMQALRKRFPGSQPPLNELFYALSDITKEITRYGVFNFLLCNGQAQFAHCSTRLYYIVRQWPFSTAHLIDADMTIDFAKYTTPADRVAVIATAPLTDNEVWTQFAPGELLMFESGQATMATKVPIPEAVQIANAANTACT